MRSSTKSRDWNLAATLFATALLGIAVAYRGTVASFYAVWRASDTYGHCFLILPICVYLAWRKRDELAAAAPVPCPAALLLFLPAGTAWLVGKATGTLFVEQVAFVTMVPILVYAFFGARVARILAFPLAFLFFAVPFGSELQPGLRTVTANMAVRGLRWSGIPVVREGLYLTTPVGEWRVADACSGLRFLVSGIALGCLFAYLMFQRATKRLIFGALSLLVPILANGLRAYVLIMVGTTTDLRLGRGFDHYVYGWLAFALAMAALFFIGFLYRDPAPPPRKDEAQEPRPPAGSGRWVALAAATVLTVAPWPWLHASLSRAIPRMGFARISAPSPVPGWVEVPDSSSWTPAFSGAASEAIATYEKDGARVRYYVAFYVSQRQGRELIQSGNTIVDPDNPTWRSMGERGRKLRFGQGTLDVRETDLRGRGPRWLVWHFYWLPDEFTASRAWAKVLQARAMLILHRDMAAVVVLAAPVLPGRTAASDLEKFLRDAYPSIHSSLQRPSQP